MRIPDGFRAAGHRGSLSAFACVPRYWELPDRTEELQQKIEASNGHLELDESYYRIRRIGSGFGEVEGQVLR